MSNSVWRDYIRCFDHSWSVDPDFSRSIFLDHELLSFDGCEFHPIRKIRSLVFSSYYVIGKNIYESRFIFWFYKCFYSSCRKLRKCTICRCKYGKWTYTLESIYESSSLHCSHHGFYIVCTKSIIYDILGTYHHLTTNKYCISIESEKKCSNTRILVESSTIVCYSCKSSKFRTVWWPSVPKVSSDFRNSFFHKHFLGHIMIHRHTHRVFRFHHTVVHRHRSIHMSHSKCWNCWEKNCSSDSDSKDTFHIKKVRK